MIRHRNKASFRGILTVCYGSGFSYFNEKISIESGKKSTRIDY